MALTATLTIPLNVVQNEYHVLGHLVVSNSDSFVVNLTQIIPRVKQTSGGPDKLSHCDASVRLDLPEVPASGSMAYLMELVFHAPSTPSTYDISCDIYSLDGQLVAPAIVTVTVNKPV